MIADPIGIPACFSSGSDRVTDDPAVTRSGQSVVMSVYRTKLGNQSRLITITWCRNPLLLQSGLSVSISGPGSDGGGEDHARFICKVELKPWFFWRKQGSKQLTLDDGKIVDVFWDLKSVKFQNGETEPSSDYYVAVVDHDDREVVLLIGDLKIEAYKKTGSRPALIDPVLVSKKEHIFGKKRFLTRAKFHDKGKFHEILIECRNNCNYFMKGNNGEGSGFGSGSGREPEMEVRVDGQLVIHVKHLQWKFRGNESISVDRVRVEVFWDVHDWLFSPGLRHALFIFKPVNPTSILASPLSSLLSSSSLSSGTFSLTGSSGSVADGSSGGGNGSSEFSLFLYAWKVE